MKICCLGDIHYNGSEDWLVDIVNNYVKDYCNGCDVTVVVGDITNYGDLTHVKEVLEIIKETVEPAPVLVVPGNHDIYLNSNEAESMDSLEKLIRFNDLVEGLSCTSLMKKPYIINDVAFVGTIGWYDYSFAPKWLGLSIDDFRAKAFGMRVWSDKDYVKLPIDDKEFTLYLLDKLEEDIKRVYKKVDKIVVVMHHIPFREMITYKRREEWDYFSAFMGSEKFGHIIRKYEEKVKLVVHGHSHGTVMTRICREINGIRCCNCASPIPLVLQI